MLVEDDAQYARLVQIAFQEANIARPICVLSDGAEAISYFRGEGQFSNREAFPLPALVVIDLRMPLISGLELLQWMRAQEDLSGIRTVVLTGSETGDELQKAISLGADSCLVKPFGFRGLVQALSNLDLHGASPRHHQTRS